MELYLAKNSKSIFQTVCCLTEELNTGIIYSFNLDQGADVAFERNLLKNTDLDKIFVFNPNYDPSKIKTEFTNQKGQL